MPLVFVAGVKISFFGGDVRRADELSGGHGQAAVAEGARQGQGRDLDGLQVAGRDVGVAEAEVAGGERVGHVLLHAHAVVRPAGGLVDRNDVDVLGKFRRIPERVGCGGRDDRSRRNRNAGKRRVEARVAENVGRDGRGADVGLAVSVARRIADGAPVEIELVIAQDRGVQGPGHGQVRALREGVGKDRIVLQVIGPQAGAERTIGRDAWVVAQVDPQAAVAIDRIAFDGVLGAGVDDGDAVAGSRVGDDVPRAGRRAADGIARGIIDPHARRRIAQRGGAVGGRADEVAFDQVVVGRTLQRDAAARVAGDDVPRGGRGSADRVRIAVGDFDAAATVAQRRHARNVGADEIALDEVAIGAGAATAI